MSATILVVDDEESIRASLAGILEDEGFKTLLAVDGVDALAIAKQEAPDLVLLDIWMPRLDGLETLQQIKDIYPDLVVIMMSGHGTIETAVKSTKMGAYDFIEKPLSLEKVLIAVNNALGMNRLREENASLRSIVLKNREIIGVSPSIQKLQEMIKLAAPSGASVLITGENGAGKELVARTIHFYSPRQNRPFVEVNCAAIPEELLEVELFGHERGAFPGTAAQKKGKLDLADGGTIFLDEIDELSLKTQAKMLHFLQVQAFERIGGTRPIDVDIRVIAATSKDLPEEIKAGSFREDLYYRLNVVPLPVPPLRERKEDIPLLIEHFLEEFCRHEGRERKVMVPEAVELMKNYDWPGNVRELMNILERLVIMAPGRSLTVGTIPEYIASSDFSRILPGVRQESMAEKSSLREAREEFEREFILQKLEENDWNISKTADVIEMERTNLHRKIRSYGIDLKK